ncbi:MAG: transcriptional regulator [Steroidobacteraceae bacterium]|nr:transcriptional regulator [Deltaproteobacteria bacterium]
MAEKKIRDERTKLSNKTGNGQLRREVWEDESGKITRYNLAYINYKIYPGDNGRVLGFDNQHGSHHRHFMGTVETIEFLSFEALEDRFDAEWQLFKKGRG